MFIFLGRITVSLHLTDGKEIEIVTRLVMNVITVLLTPIQGKRTSMAMSSVTNAMTTSIMTVK